MFKKSILAGLIISAVSGCSSISEVESSTVDREQMQTEIAQKCIDLGDKYTPVAYAVDKVSKIMVEIQERQCTVANNYSTLSAKHADVAGFLAINADKSDEELVKAMNDFDSNKPEDKKIRPQVEAFQKASDEIFEANVELASDLALQAAEIAIVAADNAQAIAYDAAGGALNSLFKSVSNESKEEAEDKEIVPIVEAYNELKNRSMLALDANTMISLDQGTIKQLNELDKIVADKVKS